MNGIERERLKITNLFPITHQPLFRNMFNYLQIRYEACSRRNGAHLNTVAFSVVFVLVNTVSLTGLIRSLKSELKYGLCAFENMSHGSNGQPNIKVIFPN